MPDPNRTILDYQPPQRADKGMNYLLWTWLGPVASFVLFLLAIVLAAERVSRIAVGGCYLLCIFAPVAGYLSGVRGLRSGLTRWPMVLGIVANLAILCLYGLLIVLILGSPDL